jgi:putative hydrolase of the HAD superfamily
MSFRPADVILLDLDDTIIDYDGSADSSWRAVCEGAARQLAGLDASLLLTTIAEIRIWYWSDPERHRQGRADLRAASEWIAGEALRRHGHEAPALARWISNSYGDLRRESLSIFPGAAETLARLRDLGVRLGLVTNGTSVDQRDKIERFQLARYFDHVFVEGEIGYGKPDERVYRRALQAFAARPADTWFVGDNLEWDVAAPQRIGLYTIWVDGKGCGLPEDAPVQPGRIIRALSDLL